MCAGWLGIFASGLAGDIYWERNLLMADWHCNIGGKQYGPIAREELIKWIQEGRVSATDLIWCEGMEQWAEASNVPEFMSVFAQSGGAIPPIGGQSVRPSRHLSPHRGGAVLTLGILGLAICCICGICAWSMGNADLKEMAAGRMDRSGEGLTSAGKICGMISVILTCVALGIYVLIFAIAAGSGAMR
jgi:hypothetical protein